MNIWDLPPFSACSQLTSWGPARQTQHPNCHQWTWHKWTHTVSSLASGRAYDSEELSEELGERSTGLIVAIKDWIMHHNKIPCKENTAFKHVQYHTGHGTQQTQSRCRTLGSGKNATAFLRKMAAVEIGIKIEEWFLALRIATTHELWISLRSIQPTPAGATEQHAHSRHFHEWTQARHRHVDSCFPKLNCHRWFLRQDLSSNIKPWLV